MNDISSWFDVRMITDKLIDFLPNLITAIGILVAFWLLAKLTRPALRRVLQRANFADSLIDLLVDNV